MLRDGFMASEPVLVNGQLCYAVIVPTAQVLIGGGLPEMAVHSFFL